MKPMSERVVQPVLSRGAASEAVEGLGWRLVLGTLRAQVPVAGVTEGAALVAALLADVGPAAAGRLEVDLRSDRVLFTVRDRKVPGLTEADVDLVVALQRSLAERGVRPREAEVSGGGVGDHGLQYVELAVDAMDIAAVRPFWRAVLGYVPETGEDGVENALTDPAGQGPSLWFQQMDAPRPQRNRIHLDVAVAHDLAEQRVRDALAAGGKLVSDAWAPSFWVLADAEGNEVCVTTWQGRDPA